MLRRKLLFSERVSPFFLGDICTLRYSVRRATPISSSNFAQSPRFLSSGARAPLACERNLAVVGAGARGAAVPAIIRWVPDAETSIPPRRSLASSGLAEDSICGAQLGQR